MRFLFALIVTMLSTVPCAAQLSNFQVNHFRIEGKSSKVAFESCSGDPRLHVEAQATFRVAPFPPVGPQQFELAFRYRLYLGSTLVDDTLFGSVTAREGNITLPAFDKKFAAKSGTYTIKVDLSGFNKPATAPPIEVVVKLFPPSAPIAMSRINGDPEINHVTIPPEGPIVLDGSASLCALAYFLGIELSDKAWNRLGGGGFGHWLTAGDYVKYGPIGSFNVRKWAEDRGYRFGGGQYHRVKLAVGSPWNEHTQLIYTEPYPDEPGEVRLRHKATGKCLFGSTYDGGAIRNWACWDDPNMVFVLDSLGGGGYRLRHKSTKKCIYGNPADAGLVANGVCWDDPNMIYLVDDLGNGEVRLRQKSTGKCLYGDASDNGIVRNWGCWNDPNMVFVIDPR